MAVGTFFKSSEDNEVTNNSQIFYYLPYREKNGNYPFFIAFTEDKVNFYFAGNVLFNNTQQEILPSTLIFSLHLYNDKYTKKELTKSLNNCLKAKHPSFDDYKLNNIDKNFTANGQGYKNGKVLDEFDLKEQTKEHALLSNILLDFLYDVRHSEVFKEANYFGAISRLINQSEFLQSIATKAEFYYQFEKLKSDYNLDDKIEIDNVKISFKYWIEILQEHNIHNTIKPKNLWFKDVENEMNTALGYQERIFSGKSYDIDIAEDGNFINKVRRIQNYSNKVKKKKERIEVTQKRKNYLKRNKEKLLDIVKESHSQREHSTSWYIDRNNIFRAWWVGNCFQRKLFRISLISIFLLFFYFIGQTLDCFNPFCTENKGNLYYLIFLLPILISILCCLDYKHLFMNLKKLPNKFWKLIKREKCKSIIILFNKSIDAIFKFIKAKASFVKLLMLPLWALIFGATHIVFSSQSFYNKLFIKNLFTYEFAFYLLVLLLSIVSTKWITRNRNKNKGSCKKKKDEKLNSKVVFGLIHYLLIILLGCFSFISWDSFWLYTAISIILFIVLFNHEKESHPNLSESTSVNKTLSMLFYGLVISFFINVFYINTEYKEYLERYEYLGHIWHHTQKEYAFSDKDKDGYFSFSEVKENYTGEYDLEINDAPKQHIKLHSTSKPVKDKDYYSYFYVYEPKDSSYQNDRSKFIVSKENLKKRLKIKKNELVSLSEKLKKVRVQLDNSKNGLDSIQQHNFNQLSDDSLNVVDKIKKDSIQLNKKIKYFNKKFFLKYIKVKKSIYQPLSDDIEVTIDKYFFKELQNVYLYKGMDYDSVNKKWYYKRSKVPVIKEINLFGIKIITIPNILFINTFLSLFIAVILQIFIHKTKFLKGGSGHGH